MSMEPSHGNSTATRLTSSWGRVSTDGRYFVLFAVGSAFAFAHTLDEMRVGQFIAVPFTLANALALGGWPRVRRGWRAALAVAFGFLWMVTAIPYHVLPLLNGAITWQNVSGLSRIAGGLILVATGIAVAARWRSRD
jgi:hypothetical protein